MKIINLFSVDNLFVAAGKKFNMLLSLMDSYLSNNNNLRTVSIILMMLAIVLFLILIVILYIKSMSALLKSSQNKQKNDDYYYNYLITQNMEKEELERVRQEELEKELARELEKAVAEQAAREEQERLATERKNKQKEDEQILAIEEKMPELKKRVSINKNNTLDLDWKKGKLKNMESLPEPPDMPLQYQQNKKQLAELLGLIVDMLGRNVNDLKIAQTIMYRNMYNESEETVLQTIDAVKDFIALCLNGKFAALYKEKNLPKEDKALYNLALGDCSLSLALLEALMDSNINKATSMQAGNKRDKLFALTSNYAQTFGALAAVNDVHLATGAFELAIELYPQNINAWNRIGDMYKLAENSSQAVKAYQNVLALADEDINTRQAANAEKMLSQFYYAQGDSLQAAKLYNRSKGYYDSIGINRRLDRQEVEIVEIIESHQSEDLNETISKILSNRNLKQYSFA